MIMPYMFRSDFSLIIKKHLDVDDHHGPHYETVIIIIIIIV